LLSQVGVDPPLSLYNDIERVNDTRQIAQQRQYNVDPEMFPQSFLEEHPKRGQQDRDDDADDIHSVTPARPGSFPQNLISAES